VLPSIASPDPEDLLVKEAAMYRHSKTSLDGLQTRKTLKKTKDVKSVFDNQGFIHLDLL